MGTKSVAVIGDVIATPGEICYTGADKGDWKAGPITCLSYSKITINGKEVIYKAECTFKFVGTNPKGIEIDRVSE